MINTITYAFPKDSSSTGFFSELSALLSELPNATIGQDKSVIIVASEPKGALPKTIRPHKAH